MADQQYCLRWNNHQTTLISVFDSLQERGCMVDCTLAAEGQSLQAHKVVLSACSPYLEDLLSKHYDKHPILLLKDVKFEELKAMMDYMYRGEVNVAQDKLNTFLRAAESLQIKGLSDGGTDPPDSGGTNSTKRTAKGTPVSVRSNQQLTVRTTNLNDDVSSRDGSVSPSLRKRRRRRGSEGSDHDTGNVPDGKQSSAAAAPVTGPSVNQDTLPIVPASGPTDDNLLSSIMESAETENATDSGISSANNAVPLQENVIRDRDNVLIEPKTEYLDDDAQDMHLDDDDSMFRAGPSHARGSGNYDGDGDDVYMANQDSGANAQGIAPSFVASDLARHAIWLKNPASPARMLTGIKVTNCEDESEVEFLEDLDADHESDDPLDCQPGRSRIKREAISPTPGDVKPSVAELKKLADAVRSEGGVATAHDLDQVGQPVGSAAAHSDLMRVQPETVVLVRPVQPEDEESELDVDGDDSVDGSPDACETCGKVFPRAVQRLRHSCPSAFACSSCEWKGPTPAARARHEAELHQDTRACLECGARCRTVYALNNHMRVHAKGKTTCACTRCGANFTTGLALRRHEADCCEPAVDVKPVLQHPKALAKAGRYLCKVCCATFGSQRSIMRHAQNAHTLKFPHKCKTCVSSFKTQRALTKHMRVHSQKRPFSCSECALSFERRAELLQHLKVHMGVSAPQLVLAIKKELGSSEEKRRFISLKGSDVALPDVKVHLTRLVADMC